MGFNLPSRVARLNNHTLNRRYGFHQNGPTFNTMKYRLEWSQQTYNLWGFSPEEREPQRGDMFECMELADSQCDGVTFQLQFFAGVLDRIIVLVYGNQAGNIFPS